jgi:uncharacterized protein (DUF1697 family)
MTTYISILRGINVGGQKSIKIEALKEMYEGLHFINVQTYIQSGNVIFQCNKSEQKDLELMISTQIQTRFGFEILVIVFETAEFKNIIDGNQFALDESKDISHLHVTFLKSVPKQIDFEIVSQYKSLGEEIALYKNAVYLYCPNGYGKTKLSNANLENKLKVGATTRNWKTTTELLRIAESMRLQKNCMKRY